MSSSCTFYSCPLGARNPTMTLMDAALHWAELGFAVFPLSPRHYAPHHELGYNADGMGGVYWATTDADVIRGWWSEWVDANVAVATGFRSGGVIAVDVDVPWSIVRNTEAWEVIRDLPLDVYETTPSGGRHVFLRAEEPVGNSVKKLAPGVDVRGDNGYVVGAPSVKRDSDSGAVMPYVLAAHPEDIPPVPRSLMERLEELEQGGPSRDGVSSRDRVLSEMGDRFVRPSVDEAELLQTGFPLGERNSTAHRLACRLWRKHGDDPEVVERILHDVWLKTDQEPTPFPWTEVMKASRSARRFILRDDDYKAPTTVGFDRTKFASMRPPQRRF